MREGSPIQFSTADLLWGLHSDAKSLLQNILPITPCGSRFYPDPSPSRPKQVIKNEYLTNGHEKNVGGGYSVKVDHPSERVQKIGARLRSAFQMNATPRARPVLSSAAGLLVRVEEVVIGRVVNQLSLTHGASSRWGRSSVGVQALDKSDVRQQLTARRPLFIPDRLQQKA